MCEYQESHRRRMKMHHERGIVMFASTLFRYHTGRVGIGVGVGGEGEAEGAGAGEGEGEGNNSRSSSSRSSSSSRRRRRRRRRRREKAWFASMVLRSSSLSSQQDAGSRTSAEKYTTSFRTSSVERTCLIKKLFCLHIPKVR